MQGRADNASSIQALTGSHHPVLAFFAELDKQTDPVQGAEAYETALQTAGNQDYQIEVPTGMAHVFVANPKYLETLEE
jgi:hypothetical protein